jgi:hypothetical protein
MDLATLDGTSKSEFKPYVAETAIQTVIDADVQKLDFTFKTRLEPVPPGPWVLLHRRNSCTSHLILQVSPTMRQPRISTSQSWVIMQRVGGSTLEKRVSPERVQRVGENHDSWSFCRRS